MEPKLHCLGPTSKKSHLKRNFLFYEIYFLFSDTEPVLIVMFFTHDLVELIKGLLTERHLDQGRFGHPGQDVAVIAAGHS